MKKQMTICFLLSKDETLRIKEIYFPQTESLSWLVGFMGPNVENFKVFVSSYREV